MLVKVWYGEYLTEDPELGRILPKKQLINEGDIFGPLLHQFDSCLLVVAMQVVEVEDLQRLELEMIEELEA